MIQKNGNHAVKRGFSMDADVSREAIPAAGRAENQGNCQKRTVFRSAS